MFSSGSKTPFGTGTFGSTSSSLFGAKTQASPFATPSFGSSTSTGFGSGTTSLFGGGGGGGSLFSQPSTQTANGFSFGRSTGTGFGASSQSSSLFQTPQASNAFGGQTFGGFGSNTSTTTASSGLFGSSFGSSTSNTTGGGLFGGSTTFGGASTNGTTIKFNPVTSSESVNKNGSAMMVQTKHQCITVMKEYEAKSLEELRMEDYTAGRKSGSSSSSLFGGTTQQPQQSLFGSSTGSAFSQSKPLTFGGFGQATTTSSSLFGQTSQSGGLFSKPVGTGSIFGSTTTTSSSNLGFGTSGGLLGQTNTGGSLFGGTSQPSGLFGSTGSGFGTTQTTSSGGLFGTGTSTFGQPQSGGLFGATSKPFGFGAANSGTSTFGTSTFGSTGSTGLFGGTATSKPGFSFNPSGTTGFGSTLSGFGGTNTSLGGGGLFGSTGATNTGGGLFGGQSKPGFGTGSSLGFGGTSSFGGVGGFGSTTGLPANQGPLMKLNAGNMFGNDSDQSSFAAFQQQKVLQQQLKALANSPFGDSALFRNLPAARKRDEKEAIVVSSSNASKVAAHYKVFSKPSIKVRMKPSPFSPSMKSKLFEKMGDEYGNSDTPFSPKRSVRKLVIKDSSQSTLDGSFENSPLRLRITDEDDDEELLSRVPVYPAQPRDESTEGSTTSTSFVESPALQEARKKTGAVGTSTESVVCENASGLTGEGNDVGADDLHNDVGYADKSPSGITLERSDYYTVPTIAELNEMVDEKGQCLVKNFIVGREDYGEVKFLGVTDVKDLNLDKIISFRRREVEVYPDEYEGKPDVGEELNKRSEISLHKVWPNDKSTLTPIKSPERLKKSGFIERLEEKSSVMGAVFLDYKPDSGTWVFQVEHFTRYGLNEQLFEDDEKGDILKKLKLAAEMKATALRNEVEREKEEALRREKALLKEKLEMSEKEGLELENISNEVDRLEIEADNEALTSVQDREPQEMAEYIESFPTSIQSAKISGVNPERVQGMKALLFDYDDEVLSPREKSLANRSLIGDGVRETILHQRFNMQRKVVGEIEDLEHSLLSQSFSMTQSPGTVPKRLKLLKSTFVSEEKAPHERQLDTLLTTTQGAQEYLEPRITVSVRQPRLISIQLSSISSKEDQICDAGLVNGRRFRVGWGPKLSLLHTGDPKHRDAGVVKPRASEREILFGSRIPYESVCPDFSVTVGSIRITDGTEEDSYLMDCLDNMLHYSKIDTERADAPFIETVQGNNALHKFVDITKKYRDIADERDIRYQHCMVWDLVNALWGHDGTADENRSTYHSRISRRTALSKWLTEVLAKEIGKELDGCKAEDDGHLDTIFCLLTGQQIEKACKVACDHREYRMALLLSQASGDSQIKHLLREQLGEWIKQGADEFMNIKRLKIFQLLSGLMVGMTAHGQINLCKDLDWKRSFALHLWFYCSTTTSIAKALEEYQNAYKGTSSYSAYAVRPRPYYAREKSRYLEESEEETKSKPKDICFHLLKLFSKRSHRLEKVLCPDTYTSDPLDYQLCWQLQQVLESLGYTHISEAYHCLIQVGFASQLEASGLWEWAVFILLHIRDDKRREAAVRETISRHCHADSRCDVLSTKEKLLIESMKIPPQWIYEAKAQHAHYSSQSYDEAFYLLKAGKWNEAHKVIVTELAADAIIDEDYQTLRNLLLQLSLPERSCSIKCWKQSGEVFLDYILLRQKLVQIEKGEMVTSAYNLEDLRGEVTSLICMIGNLKSDTAKERLAQAEMGKNASDLLKVVLGELSEQGVQIEEDEVEVHDKKYTWPMFDVAPYIATLPLPPDYIQQELEELVCNTDMDYNEDF